MSSKETDSTRMTWPGVRSIVSVVNSAHLKRGVVGNPDVSQAEAVCHYHLRDNGTERQRYSALLNTHGNGTCCQHGCSSRVSSSGGSSREDQKLPMDKHKHADINHWVRYRCLAAVFQSAQRKSIHGRAWRRRRRQQLLRASLSLASEVQARGSKQESERHKHV